MRKNTFFDFPFLKQGKITYAVGLMLLPLLGISQTKEQIQQIKQKTNLNELKKIGKSLGNERLSVSMLKTKANVKGIPFSGVSKGKQFQLVGFDKWTDVPMYYTTYNYGALVGTSTNRLHSSGGVFNLEGEGMIVYEWDGGGVLTSHQEFGGRAIQKDNANDVVSHSTHVAGTMIAAGVDPNAIGMAPKAKLYAYEWTDDELEMVEAAKNGALVSNHSYGTISGFAYGNYSGQTGWHWFGADEDLEYKKYGKYGDIDRRWDIISLNAPYYLPVKAAGNDRGNGPEPGGDHYVMKNGVWTLSNKVRQKNGGEDGFDVINEGGLGKNILTVGAAHKLKGEYHQGIDVEMADFSSFGPVDDGRIKPDITGIGVDIYSTDSKSDDSYTSISGTSMASPNVAGSLILLQQHYSNNNSGEFMRSATLKALVTGTANEAGEHAGPDYASGWGLLNSFNAASAISSNGKYSLISENVLDNGAVQTIDVKASGLEPLKVTIAWVDPVLTDNMMPSENLNDRKKTLVNDLDIRVFKDGQEYLPWVLNPNQPNQPAAKGDNSIDNVEQIVVQKPEAGATYQIRVSHKNNLKKNEFAELENGLKISLVDADSQNYSMVVTGINQGVDLDLSLEKIEVSVPPLNYTDSTPVNFEILNKALLPSNGGKLVYKLINRKSDVVEDSGEVAISPISSGESKTITVNMDLSKSFVDYIIRAKIELDNDEYSINNSAEIGVYGFLADLREDGTSYSFGFETSPSKEGWRVEDKNHDGKTWAKITDETLSKTGTDFVLNFSNTARGNINDWLFTNPIYIKANTKYRIIYNVKKFQETPENIAVYFGDQANSSAMENELGEEIVPLKGNVDNDYEKYSYEFDSDVDKIIYIGFNNKVPQNKPSFAIAIDDVTIERANGLAGVEFKADKTKATSYDVVSFTSTIVETSSDPVTSYRWEFTPNTVEYQDNTTEASKNPKVIFNEEGVYSVKLLATNSVGEAAYERENYIEIENIKTKATFVASNTNVLQGEVVTFTNTSTGDPMPNDFEWTISPSDGVELQTSLTDKHLVAKFNEPGKYSITLKASSSNNSDTFTAEDLISVGSIRPPVKNLTSTQNEKGNLQLNWEKPIKLPVYLERFFSSDELPVDMVFYDANEDGASWFPTDTGYKGTPAAFSLSWYYEFFSADDWLVTPKINNGAEVLKFMAKNVRPERYDVYVVPATNSGDHPTKDEILATGTKVYVNDLNGASKEFREIDVDISEYTNTAFHIAFHHRTLAEDKGITLILDNIMVGFNDSPYDSKIEESKNVDSDLAKLLEHAEDIDKALIQFDINKYSHEKQNIHVNFGVLDLPKLKGYLIEKDGKEMELIEDVNNTKYNEVISNDGTYTYKVYAAYSDAQSEPVTIMVDVNSLSSEELTQSEEIHVYPNPSTGKFVIENGSSVTSFNVSVVNLAGQLVYQNSYSGYKADLDLTQFSKGVYLLNITDDNLNKKTVKVIIK